ncbi:MAG TPA: DNA ligase [Tepidisphaeraceae bacterium]|nr:DNA ligase [Tepidisphaeraceae bacterium]
MPDLNDGESTEMKGSGAKPYILKNVGGVYSCTCPAWRNQSTPIERRTCKHLRKLRGDEAETARLGGALPQKPVVKTADGEEAKGPPVLLAESWDNAADLAGWWMSEKLDGVRAYWDGTQFLSRLGNLYHAPDWFIEGFPKIPLDGELWIDRKKFQRTVSIVRRQDKTDLWKEVRYLVFDAPAAPGGFEDRLKVLNAEMAASAPKYARTLEHQLCKDIAFLRAELARVEALGGEGLMLRQPGSKYEVGRSSTLLKVKTFLDAEAVVISHEDGAGKHKGRLGALGVRLANGKEFFVGTGFSDRERDKPPAIGSTITFRYQELSEAGIPRFPSYVGERIDVTLAAGKAKTTPAAAATHGSPAPSSTAPVKSTPAKAAPAASKPAAAATPVAKASSNSGKSRRFEFSDDKSNKFWEVSRNGADMTTRWGRIGAAGQSKTKTFPDEAAATKQVEKLIEEKTDEGYEEKTE